MPADGKKARCENLVPGRFLGNGLRTTGYVLHRKDGTITKPFTIDGGKTLDYDWARVYFIPGNDAIGYLDAGPTFPIGMAMLIVGPCLIVGSIIAFYTLVLRR